MAQPEMIAIALVDNSGYGKHFFTKKQNKSDSGNFLTTDWMSNPTTQPKTSHFHKPSGYTAEELVN